MTSGRLCAVLACACAGCSFFTVQGPKQVGFECTTSYAGPIVDLAAVTTVTALLVTAIAGTEECDDLGCTTNAFVSPIALVGGLFAASSLHGALVVGSCRDHREKLTRDVADLLVRLESVAAAGECDEVRRAVVIAEALRKDLGDRQPITSSAVLRCLQQVEPSTMRPPAAQTSEQ